MFNNKRIERLEVQLGEALSLISDLDEKLLHYAKCDEILHANLEARISDRTNALAANAGKQFATFYQRSTGECLIDKPKVSPKAK